MPDLISSDLTRALMALTYISELSVSYLYSDLHNFN
jgi:hypothetical protein